MFWPGAERRTVKSTKPSPSPTATSNGAEIPGCETAVASLAPIVTVPVPRVIVAWMGVLRASVKLSAGSSEPSSAIGTTTVLAVSPGAKESVPPAAV